MPAEFRNLTSQKRTVQISKSRFRNETNSPDFEESFSERLVFCTGKFDCLFLNWRDFGSLRANWRAESRSKFPTEYARVAEYSLQVSFLESARTRCPGRHARARSPPRRARRPARHPGPTSRFRAPARTPRRAGAFCA